MWAACTHVPSRSLTSYLSSMDCDFSASFFVFFDTSFLPNSGMAGESVYRWYSDYTLAGERGKRCEGNEYNSSRSRTA